MGFLDVFSNNEVGFRSNIDLKKVREIQETGRKIRMLSRLFSLYDLDELEGLEDYSEIFTQIEGGGIFLTPKEIQLISIDYDFNEIYNKIDEERKSVIIDESNRIKRILQDIYKDNSKILTLEFWEFEEMVAELLHKQGYKVELTKKTKDNGYDIIALMNINMHNPLKFLVQCKRYTKDKVGVDVIRSFKEVIDTEKANRGIVVTTSYFTKGALQKQAEMPYLLDYRDKDKVIEWVKEYFKSSQI